MLQRFLSYFSGKGSSETYFDHPALGRFVFVSGIGWTTALDIDGHPVQLYLGSDGELPNQSMLDCLNYWIGHWSSRRSEINEFISRESCSWPPSELAPQANRLQLNSIQILWPAEPWSCMVYLVLPDCDERDFHVTFDGTKPVCFALDH